MGSAHLPNQQPYQAGNGDGAPRIPFDSCLDITLNSGELVLRDRGGLRQAVSGRAHGVGYLVSGRGNLFLS
jgi:hypothetical protein